MGSFGAPTPKATRLYSNVKGVLTRLKKPLKRNVFAQAGTDHATATSRDRYVDKKGTRRMHGGKGLKQSQAYPLGFGDAVASVYREFRFECRPPSHWVDLTQSDEWDDAELAAVVRDVSP
jgi:hypothetical protein